MGETSCKKFTRPCPTLKRRQQCHSHSTAARPAVPGGYYWHLRQQINAVSNAQASNHMWHSPRCKFSAIRTVLNVRYGSLWTAHRARTMGRPYVTDQGTITNGSCPFCPAPLDSAGHLLGECSRNIKSMQIARHNHDVGLIQDAIASGPWGAATWLCMHVAVALRLILLPPRATHPARVRDKLRLDILIIEGLSLHACCCCPALCLQVLCNHARPHWDRL